MMRNCISALSSRNTLLMSLCLSVPSWTKSRAKQADMTGTTRVFCSSKVFGSQAGYPKAPKKYNIQKYNMWMFLVTLLK